MKSRNLVLLRGNLGGDPESQVLPSGERVAKLRLATNTYLRGPTGERVARTDWHRVEAWGRTAEFALTSLRKGDKVQVMGVLRQDVVTAPAGTKKYFVHVRAYEVESFNPRPGAPERGPLPNTADPDPEGASFVEEEMPF